MGVARISVIYVWLCPTSGIPVYVGKTSMSLSRRMNNHRRRSIKRATTPKEKWLASIAKTGKSPVVLELDRCPVSKSSALERRWISRLSARYRLLNADRGGAGNPGIGRIKWTPDLLNKLGKMPDSELAAIVGCHRKTVSYKRECLGIGASFSRANNLPPPAMGGWNKKVLPSAIIGRLGSVPDYILAQEAHVTKHVIARCRRSAGIPSYAVTTGNNGRIREGEPHRRWKV